MSSKPERTAGALRAFTFKTEDFIGDILREASARGFCRACALNFAARLVVAACQVVEHQPNAASDELPSTAFDDKPGHA